MYRYVQWSLSSWPLSTEATLSNVATNFWGCYLWIHLLFPLAKGHLSNMATISWQIGWPYYMGTTVAMCMCVPGFLWHGWQAARLPRTSSACSPLCPHEKTDGNSHDHGQFHTPSAFQAFFFFCPNFFQSAITGPLTVEQVHSWHMGWDPWTDLPSVTVGVTPKWPRLPRHLYGPHHPNHQIPV